MSTVPRVPSAVEGEPATFRSAMAHRPAVASAFFELYGELWSRGLVEPSVKEVARLRNARITDCGY
jgi:hypothetical protein